MDQEDIKNTSNKEIHIHYDTPSEAGENITTSHDTNRNEPRWIFKKDISIGNILTMAGLVVGLFAWGNAIDRRLAILEEKSTIHISTDARQDQSIKESKDEQRQRLDRIEDKLDAALSSIRNSSPVELPRTRK
jgi:hypothetical protein